MGNPNKVVVPPTNPGAPADIVDPRGYNCVRCGRHFKRQRGNFPKVQSPIYFSNQSYLTVCRHCVHEMYERYLEALGDEKAAVRRVCMKFDVYWGENVWKTMARTGVTQSRALAYFTKANLMKFGGKTFDDTLDEESVVQMEAAQEKVAEELQSIRGDDEEMSQEALKETMDYWGAGLPSDMYLELEKRRAYWASKWDTENIEPGAEALLRQVCILEVSINHDIAAGKSVEKQSNALNTLMGSLNLKPIQQKKDAMASSLTANPLGTVWKMIEDEEPIPEAEGEFKDADGIRRYIMIWFFGCLCNMLGISNKYSRLYKEEIERLKVERPEYEGDDDDVIVEDIFERAERQEEERRKALEIDQEKEDDGTDGS